MKQKRLPIVVIIGSLCALLVAYGSAFTPGGARPWSAWVMAVGTSTMIVSMMALGAMRDGRLGRLKIPFALVLLILVGGFTLALALPEVDPADPNLWLGLPAASAVVLYGIGLLPLFAIPLAYALTFDEMTLSAEDLERVRAAALQLRTRESASAAEADEGVEPKEMAR